jgi:hypothetical protein
MGRRGAATEHAASSHPAMIVLMRDIMVVAGRSRPLMEGNGDRFSLRAICDFGLDLGLGLRRRSRNTGSRGAGACRCRAHETGEGQHHHGRE